MLFNDISRLRQLACCRYFKRVSLSRFEVLFEHGDFGDRFFTIVSGKVSMLINGHEVRQKGQGESPETRTAKSLTRWPTKTLRQK